MNVVLTMHLMEENVRLLDRARKLICSQIETLGDKWQIRDQESRQLIRSLERAHDVSVE